MRAIPGGSAYRECASRGTVDGRRTDMDAACGSYQTIRRFDENPGRNLALKREFGGMTAIATGLLHLPGRYASLT